MRAVLAPYLPLLAVLLAGLVGQVRAFVPATGFWHGKQGHWLLSLGGALLSAGATIAARGDLSKQALIMALTGAATAYFSATKPMGLTQSGPPSIPVEKVGAVLLPFLFFFVSACGTFGQCVKSSGLASSGTIEKQVSQVLSGTISAASVNQSLEQIALGLVPTFASDAYVLVACAITSWESAHPMPTAASPSPGRMAAYSGAATFMAAHLGS